MKVDCQCGKGQEVPSEEEAIAWSHRHADQCAWLYMYGLSRQTIYFDDTGDGVPPERKLIYHG
jgi:hypothetical protein